ncbi:MAG: hypothetical protein DMG95_08365 [Acidobacteria bacterium]|nr:MAG: hypothetical protein DMG95_08365 [Acidobacteriota bacterium]
MFSCRKLFVPLGLIMFGAMARRLAVRLYWMWRQGQDYEQLQKFGSHAGQPGNRDGVQAHIE